MPLHKNIDTIIVAIKLTRDVNIPVNSLAAIKDNPLGAASMEIDMGDSKSYLKNHDTIFTIDNPGLLGNVAQSITPVVDQVKVTLHTLDSVLNNLNTVFDVNTKNNLRQVVGNVDKVTASLVISAASLQNLMSTQSGMLAKSMTNLNSFSSNLAGNNDKINATLNNLQASTANLSKADVDGTVNQLRFTVEKLNTAVEKIDSKNGSLGRLLNDNQLYDNLAKTTRSLNVLMDDIRVNPKRYVSISIFGGKANKEYLTSPLPVPDTSTAVTMQ